MPQYPRDPNSLNVLDALRSSRNMTPTGNGYFDKRRQQIMSGDDELGLSPVEQLQAQNTEGVGTYSTPAGSATLSRDMINDSGIFSLKRKLRLEDDAEKSALAAKLALGQQTGDYGLAGKYIEGQYAVRAAEGSARAGMDRLLASQQGQDQRTADQIASREKIANGSQAGATARAGNAVPYQMSRDLAKAKEGYNGGFAAWTRNHLGMDGGARDYEAALTATLRRTGSLDMITKAAQQTVQEGKTAEQALNEARLAGVTLDPDEQDALRLFVEKYKGGR